MKRCWSFFVCAALWLSVGARAPAGTLLDSLEEEITQILKSARPAVVSVTTEPLLPAWWDNFTAFAPPSWFQKFSQSDFSRRKARSNGSGFIIDPAGRILTTANVIRHAKQVTVLLSDGSEFPAEVIGKEKRFNIALLKIEGKNLPYLPLGDSAGLKIGSWAIAVGNPFGLFQSPSWGLVSGLGRSGLGIAPYEDLIQITAPINPGDSGGPLLDAKGEVVGILTATLSGYREFELDFPFCLRFREIFPDEDWVFPGGMFQPSLAQGIGFAIPVDLAKDVVSRLKEGRETGYGWLGVKIEEAYLGKGEAGGERGVVIREVLPGGPAARAGIRENDTVLAIAGKEVRTPQELKRAVIFSPIGGKVDVELLREGQRIALPVTIEKQPPFPEGE